MHRLFLSVLIVTALLLSGCAFWKGFKSGLSGEDLTVETVSKQEQVGHVVGDKLVDAQPYFPSPWREILIAFVAAVTGWGAGTTKKPVAVIETTSSR